MPKFTVIQTIQSSGRFHALGEKGTPVDIKFYEGTDHAQALAALVSCSAEIKDDKGFYYVLGARIEIEA